MILLILTGAVSSSVGGTTYRRVTNAMIGPAYFHSLLHSLVARHTVASALNGRLASDGIELLNSESTPSSGARGHVFVSRPMGLPDEVEKTAAVALPQVSYWADEKRAWKWGKKGGPVKIDVDTAVRVCHAESRTSGLRPGRQCAELISILARYESPSVHPLKRTRNPCWNVDTRMLPPYDVLHCLIHLMHAQVIPYH